jgi:hypothetical protein
MDNTHRCTEYAVRLSQYTSPPKKVIHQDPMRDPLLGPQPRPNHRGRQHMCLDLLTARLGAVMYFSYFRRTLFSDVILCLYAWLDLMLQFIGFIFSIFSISDPIPLYNTRI